jgi:hypothetical protein
VAAAVFCLLIAAGATAAGVGYIRAARRMRHFETTSGRITGRGLDTLAGVSRGEACFGSGGRYTPKVTYTYVVDGATHTSEKYGYARSGWRKSVAEQKLAAIPDEPTVYFNPDAPDEAYLQLHRPALGYVMVGGGTLVFLIGLVALLD